MILDLFKLTDRTALVTGARRGLGRGIAVGLAEAGADIACVSQSGEADDTRRRVEATGRRFLDIQLDLADPDARVGLVERVAEELGTVDILVNNAGGAVADSVARTSTGRGGMGYVVMDWRRINRLRLRCFRFRKCKNLLHLTVGGVF